MASTSGGLVDQLEAVAVEAACIPWILLREVRPQLFWLASQAAPSRLRPGGSFLIWRVGSATGGDRGGYIQGAQGDRLDSAQFERITFSKEED